ncbi:hypothetical protein HYPSUDRAFT_209876, partial [Hypholoma sublateritium FD-334 SS-4]
MAAPGVLSPSPFLDWLIPSPLCKGGAKSNPIYCPRFSMTRNRRVWRLFTSRTSPLPKKRTLSPRILELQSPDFLASLNWLLDLSPEILDTYLQHTKGIDGHNAKSPIVVVDPTPPTRDLSPRAPAAPRSFLGNSFDIDCSATGLSANHPDRF